MDSFENNKPTEQEMRDTAFERSLFPAVFLPLLIIYFFWDKLTFVHGSIEKFSLLFFGLCIVIGSLFYKAQLKSIKRNNQRKVVTKTNTSDANK